ncbi:MAG: DUF3108 domain-containing protein [Rugosibacter sp.]|jgi:hypothetical protein|nr:hypothetical protein [Rugosibacter sp.]
MPIALALLASAILHVAAILGPAWDLPGLDADNAPVSNERLDVVIKPTEPNLSILNKAQPKPATEPQRLTREKPRRTSQPPRPDTAPKPATNASEAQVAVSPAPTFSAEDHRAADQASAADSASDAQATAPETADASTSQGSGPQAIPFPLPAQGRMRFDISRGERGFVVGQSINTWSHDGAHYRLQNVSETTGLAALFKSAQVVQTSQGEITPQGLRPLSFSNERKGKKETASFDWQSHLVSFDGQSAALPDGAQDMLSLYYQLALLIASGRPPMASINLVIASGRKLENYHFESLGEETITALGQENPALHLRTHTGKDVIDLWIAKTLVGLPLKIRFTDRKGEVFEQLVTEMSTTNSTEKPSAADPASHPNPDNTSTQ